MRAARLAAVSASVVALLALTGCIQSFGPTPTASAPETSTPATSPPATPTPSDTTPSTDPSEPLFEYTTSLDAQSPWSFEVSGAEIVESDSDGTPADPGHVLVVLYVSGQRLGDNGNFYFDFRVGSVNEETDQFIGLSSGTDFYADNDLFSAGELPVFRDARAIFQVPEDWPLGTWRFLFHETGEEWIIEAPVE